VIKLSNELKNKTIKRSSNRKRECTNNYKTSETTIFCGLRTCHALHQTCYFILLATPRKGFKCCKNNWKNKFPKQDVQRNKTIILFSLSTAWHIIQFAHFADPLHWMVFDFISYCVTMKTLYSELFMRNASARTPS